MKQPNPSSGWREQLTLHKERIFWKSNPNIKGLSLRDMYDAEFIEHLFQSTLYQLIADVKEEVIGEDEVTDEEIETRGYSVISLARDGLKKEQRSKLSELEKKYVNGLEKK